MARFDKKKKLRPSIIDRLMDKDPNNNVDMDRDQHQQLKDLRNSVRRDLENLLNTRYRIREPDERFSQLKKSIVNYGLPDLATVNMSDKTKLRGFINHLESIIIEFEPRFKSVKISYIENPDSLDCSIRFRIDATLFADPSPEVVIFDSVLEPVTRMVHVKEAGRGR